MQSFFFPGQYYDYRWPMILAGHDSINTDASDSRAGAPNGDGGIATTRSTKITPCCCVGTSRSLTSSLP